MKAFIVITIARMINGEFVFVKCEKAFTNREKADTLAKELSAKIRNKDGTLLPIKISTEQGEAICHREVGVFDVDIEE
jgi:hypothetical protein